MKWANFSLILVILVFFVSCSKQLEYDSDENNTIETVNGITIHWANGVSEEQMDILRTVVNDMVFVEGGTFSMGVNKAYDPDARKNEGPVHLVELSDYYICSRELTAEQIASIVGNSAGIFPKQNSVHFSYSDWVRFIELLNGYTGLEFDFPTEAQWEYAARGGKESRYFLYPGSDEWSMAWSDGSEEWGPSVPNELGLFNMADSRAEWCKDMYAEYDATVLSVNPCNLFGSNRVVRGGCSESKSTYKSWFSETSTTYNSFHSAKIDYRICRSTARSYGYGTSNSNVTWRPVINIPDYEQ